MKKIILCAVALVFTAMSYAQLPQVQKITPVQEVTPVESQFKALAKDFKLDTNQSTLLKKYLNLDTVLNAKGLGAAAIATQKEAMLAKIANVLPEGLVSKLTTLQKTAGGLNTIKKASGF
jgi:hypothetical protein